jgi:hypothetical protein
MERGGPAEADELELTIPVDDWHAVGPWSASQFVTQRAAALCGQRAPTIRRH